MFAKIKKIVVSKTFLIVFSVVLSTGMIFGTYTYKARALTICSNGLYCFGGQITNVEVCCNGLKITVKEGDYGGKFLFGAGSMLYMWWNLSQQQCVLGDAYMGGVCIKPASWPPCSEEEQVDGTIRQIGTTLAGPAQGTCQNITKPSEGGGSGGGFGGGGGGGFGGGGAQGGF